MTFDAVVCFSCVVNMHIVYVAYSLFYLLLILNTVYMILLYIVIILL